MEQAVREVFRNWNCDERGLVARLDALARSRGEEVYKEIFRYLTGRDFEAPTAGRYWREALVRWESTSGLRPAQQRVRGALLDYLYQVVGEKFGAATDGLTGLYTHAFARHHIDKLIAYKRFRNCRRPLALVLLEVDGFGAFNARHGSLAGDRVLRQLADLLRQGLREIDVAARCGGSSFALILPDSNRFEAFTAAKNVRATLLGNPLATAAAEGEKLDIRFGVATYPEAGENSSKLYREAERALLPAREASPPLTGSAERRQDRRQAVCSLVEFTLGKGGEFIPALATDISRTGIAFGCDADLPPGTPLQIRFRQPFWPQTREVAGTVRRAEREALRGLNRIGLEFAAPVDALSRPTLC